MNIRTTFLALTLTSVACGSDPSGGPLGGSLTVTGTVHDFQTGSVLAGDVNVATSALVPPPTISVEGASFVIDGVPENSAFQILASASTHRATFSTTTEVIDADVADVKVYAVSEQLVADLAMGFGVTPSAASGIVFMQLVDSGGNPKADVDGSNIVLAGVTTAAKFLDANLAPAPALTASSTSGWAVLFDVPPGVVTVAQPVTATATIAAPSAPVAAATVTLVRATVTEGAPPELPTNVSFAGMIVPIFTDRGCIGCHSGNGPGKDLGGLQLDGGVNKVHRELTIENPLRAQPAMPEMSLVLTMPSAESPSDGHPNVTFTGPQDADYIKLLVWLREGAKNN